ncbi:hypothetical protein B0T24DRAFT_642968 [Lasiosphaeria ovina]|uniref:Zn(2)-C6 fungal-type domain-containing protein n=1 Tax=Lasiosphaeria ovina TaxID=92902 RepID=A0AAE0JTS5_9PEZI|nr:hypothetical protein B0T24DRAFT_642968 [Lasiosphaeria ovina]
MADLTSGPRDGGKIGLGREGNKAQRDKENTARKALKRLSCETCRTRKIRCDRQHPICGRCARLGDECCYLDRAKAPMSKTEMLVCLDAMNRRLQQAEAKLALHVDDDPEHTPPATNSTHSMSPPQANTEGLAPIPDLSGDWPDMEMEDYGFNFDALSYTTPLEYVTETSQTMSDASQFNAAFPDITPLPLCYEEPRVFPSIIQTLHARYFELFHPFMPLVNKPRLEAELAQTPPSKGAQALSTAIATLAAFSDPSLRCHVDRHYDECRTLLDLCERQATDESLATINTLQALTVLALFEFKQPCFARAWMTLGRAIRLAKMMGLDRAPAAAPRRHNASAVGERWGAAKMQGCPPLDAAAAEERRRTFWVLYILEAFSTTQTDEALTLEMPVHIPLPSPSEYPDGSSLASMPSIHEILDARTTDNTTQLSPLAGNAVMVCLYRRCAEHITASISASTSASHQHTQDTTTAGCFWETHYAIADALAHCRHHVLAAHTNPHNTDGIDGARTLPLRMNLAAVEISLHEAALSRVTRACRTLPGALADDAASRCAAAAGAVVDAVQRGRFSLGLAPGNGGGNGNGNGIAADMFRQHDRFLVWPLAAAARVYVRIMSAQKGEGVVDGDAGVVEARSQLRVLAEATRDLVRPEHVPPGLLGEVDALVR